MVKRLGFLFLTLTAIILLWVGRKFFSDDPQKSHFSYQFYNSKVVFPIRVGEAIKYYNVLPHNYNKAGKSTSACLIHAKNNTVSEIFYVSNADDYNHAPSDSLNRDVYAIAFCFSQPSEYKNIITKLETDFKQKFKKKKSFGTGEPYLQMKVYEYLSIIIDFYPEFKYSSDKNISKTPDTWTISFCYNLHDSTISHYVSYERAYDAQ